MLYTTLTGWKIKITWSSQQMQKNHLKNSTPFHNKHTQQAKGRKLPQHNKSHMWDLPGGPVVKNPPSNAVDMGLTPGQWTKIPHATGQLSPRATTTELTRLNERACVPQTTEPMSSGARTRDRKTCTPQLERSPACHNKVPMCRNKKISHASTQILHAATKAQCSQERKREREGRKEGRKEGRERGREGGRKGRKEGRKKINFLKKPYWKNP